MPILGIYNSQLSGKWKNWINLTSRSGSDVYPKQVSVDSSSNVYASFYDTSGATAIQFNSAGKVNWQKVLTISGDTLTVNSSVIDSANNMYVIASQLSDSSYVLIKYNSSGTLQWQVKLKPVSFSAGGSITVDSSDNVYICGSYYTTRYIPLVAKYNSSGTLRWQTGLDLTNDGFALRIICDSSNNVYVSTYTYSSNYYLLKYNSSGTLQTQYQTSQEYVYGFAVDSSGNIYAPSSDIGMGIAKFNSSGILQWQSYIGKATGATLGISNNVILDSSGNVYLVGAGDYAGAPNTNTIAMFNSSGVVQWKNNFFSTTRATNLQYITFDSNNNNLVLSGRYVNTNQQGITIVVPNDGSNPQTFKFNNDTFTYATSSYVSLTGSTVPNFTATTFSTTTPTNTATTSTATNGTAITSLTAIM